MLQSIVYKYLKSDTKLLNILGGTDADTKIYPNTTGRAAPCIIYYCNTPSNVYAENFILSEIVTLEWYANDEKQSIEIQTRLLELMNLFDGFFINDADKSGLIVRCCRLTSGGVENNYPLENSQFINQSVSFEIIFTKCPNGQKGV